MTLAQAGMSTAPPLARREPPVTQTVDIPVNDTFLQAKLVIPSGAHGLVLSMVADEGDRGIARNAVLARQLEASRLATLSFELRPLGGAELNARSGAVSCDLSLMTGRLLQVTRWAKSDVRTRGLGMGYLGTGRGTAASLVAAAQLGYAVQAVVSYGGQPRGPLNLLAQVTAPTLLIVGEWDTSLLHTNRQACDQLSCRKELAIVPRAGHAFAEIGALSHVAVLAADWFREYLNPIPVDESDVQHRR
jgi:putative phosphoribosyl transferase